MFSPAIQKELDAIIASLPTTEEEIAQLFTREEVRGLPKNVCHCPLANWICGSDSSRLVYVLGGVSIVNREGKVQARARLTPAMSVFIQKFDTGHYPELIES